VIIAGGNRNERIGVRRILIPFLSLSQSAHQAGAEALVMSLSETVVGIPVTEDSAPTGMSGISPGRPLHRIAAVRHQQGMSLRTVSRHMGVEGRILKQQEEETTDLPLSALYRWQEALGVPVADLLVESDATLSPPVMERARMIRVMKTVAAIMENADTPSIRRLAQTLADQLVEIMPELEGVGPWPAIGQRRSLDDYGRAADRRLGNPVFRDL
jgi:transcriptional regulator with XRE-family HTH domain